MASSKGNSAAHHRNRPVPVNPIHPTAIAIAKRPVSEWRTALASVPESERESVRADIKELYEWRKYIEQCDRDVEEGKAVWISIPKGFKP